MTFDLRPNSIALQTQRTMRLLVLCICVIELGTLGCNSNPYLATQPGMAPPGAQANMNPAAGAQVAELERRVRLLDDNNRQLTTQLAQSQQQMQVYRDRSDLMARQMQDLNGQLAQAKVGQSQAADQVKGIQANIQRRGGAILAANSSLARQADQLKGIGFPVQVDGDVIRVQVPADQLFPPGTSQLNPDSAPILDRVADSLLKNFPRQRVGIEGHTDNSGLMSGSFTTPHQLAAAQSNMVMDYLTRRAGMPANQLYTLSHGPNRPIADPNSAAGRSQNRRIEVVVYPDTF